MKLQILVELDSGGSVLIEGENLSAEDVNEVFGILAHKKIGSVEHKEHPRD